MAEHSPAQAGAVAESDYDSHEHTYRGFLRLVKYAVAAIALILILMAIFLT